MTYPMLIPEPPIQVLPALAELVGFNEAAALQEIHYWINLQTNTDFKEGRYWVPNVCAHLCQRFFFWDEDAIKYMVAQLEELGILMVPASFPQDFNRNADMNTYHTINYDLLKERDSSPLKLISAAPFIQENPPVTNANERFPFMAETHEKGPDLYTLVAQDLSQFLTCELILEIQNKDFNSEVFEDEAEQEELASREVICHFPKIEDEQFRKSVYDDDTLYAILMMRFHMKIMEQLLLFCADHDVAQLVIFADDTQADELKIYHDFLIHQDQTLTPQGEKTEMVFPANQKAFDCWIDFMEETMNKFRQILWREQKTNLAIRYYLKTQGLLDA